MIFNNRTIRSSFITSLLILLLACTPTITLGLGLAEIGVIIFLAILLFGPLIFGLIRRLGQFKADNDKQ